jgi:hypothetical protein
MTFFQFNLLDFILNARDPRALFSEEKICLGLSSTHVEDIIDPNVSLGRSHTLDPIILISVSYHTVATTRIRSILFINVACVKSGTLKVIVQYS